MFWTTPWVWKIHGYPDDYWRYTPSAVRQVFSFMDWCFEGFEVIFDDHEKSILFDWEKGMENHVFEITKKAFDKLTPLVDCGYYKALISGLEKKVTLVDRQRSEVFSTKKFDVDTYTTLISGKSLTMLPMCNLFMIGKKM